MAKRVEIDVLVTYRKTSLHVCTLATVTPRPNYVGESISTIAQHGVVQQLAKFHKQETPPLWEISNVAVTLVVSAVARELYVCVVNIYDFTSLCISKAR